MPIFLPHADIGASTSKHFEQDYPESYVSGIAYFALAIIAVSLLVSFLACKFLVPTTRIWDDEEQLIVDDDSDDSGDDVADYLPAARRQQRQVYDNPCHDGSCQQCHAPPPASASLLQPPMPKVQVLTPQVCTFVPPASSRDDDASSSTPSRSPGGVFGRLFGSGYTRMQQQQQQQQQLDAGDDSRTRLAVHNTRASSGGGLSGNAVAL